MVKIVLMFALILLPVFNLFSQKYEPHSFLKKNKLYSDKFKNKLNPDIWHIEMDSLPGSQVFVKRGKLILDTKGGVTLWLKRELKGNLLIEYRRSVLVEKGENDRLSDLNQFWMATDPQNPNLFTRKGKFAEYDSISMYYVGFGGNHNTTTRFRKYLGNGERVILDEKNEPHYLLEANKSYQIQILVYNGFVSYWVDGICFFEYTDPEPLTKGYFGFRSTWSHQHISNLKIYSLE